MKICRWAFAFLIMVGVCLSGCSVKSDAEMICMAPKKSDMSKVSAAEKSQVMAKYIAKNIRTPKANAFFSSLGNLPPAEREKSLRKFVKESGYTGECPILDVFGTQTKNAVEKKKPADRTPKKKE